MGLEYVSMTDRFYAEIATRDKERIGEGDDHPMTAFDATTTGSLAEGDAHQNDAAASDTNVVFPTGSVIECQTSLSTRITGQVLSYDHPTRLLLISLS